MSARPRFRIGDLVRVNEIAVPHRTVNGGERTIYHTKLSPPVDGWIVGASRRFSGKIKGYYSKGYYDGEGDAPYLERTGSVLVWKVARSLMNVPLEATFAGLTLLSPASNVMMPRCPLRLGEKWPSNGWSKDEQRDLMHTWPRDANGRWLKAVRR